MVSSKVPPDSRGGVVQSVEGLGIPSETESTKKMLQEVLSKPRNIESKEPVDNKRINGIVIGMLSEPGENGRTMVYYPGIPGGEPLTAISTENLASQNQGAEVALGFVNGNPAMPIILGLIHKSTEQEETVANEATEGQSVDVRLDGEKLTLSADKEIVLKCGKSSITLTRAGKIIVKGSYLSNHSTGVNRIKGGSVQIN